MEDTATGRDRLLCPSAQPPMAESVIFGIVGGTAREPQLLHLAEPQPATDKLLALSGPVSPTEIFRFAAPCAGGGCQHFDGARCRLATRIVELLPPVMEGLPPCRLRPHCRWWGQEGKAACQRCPQIVTETYHPSEPLRQAAAPGPPPGSAPSPSLPLGLAEAARGP